MPAPLPKLHSWKNVSISKRKICDDTLMGLVQAGQYVSMLNYQLIGAIHFLHLKLFLELEKVVPSGAAALPMQLHWNTDKTKRQTQMFLQTL